MIRTIVDFPTPTKEDLRRVARTAIKGSPYAIPTSVQLWAAYRSLRENGLERNERLEQLLRIKDTRTDSGVAPITVLTKPWPCPGRCVYCPTETRMPKSYLSTEPAAARALSLQFDPYEQVVQRVRALEANGHRANKIELIIKGGTWSAYPMDYREWFITRCFEAANGIREGKSSKSPLSRGLSDNGGKFPFIPYDSKLKEKAKEYRLLPTIAEQKFWNEVLCARRTGYLFLRQKPLASFIVDFYCSALMLAIEIDGSSHVTNPERDEERTAILNTFGLQVIRFTNDQVMNDIESVKTKLTQIIQQRQTEINNIKTYYKSPLDKGDLGDFRSLAEALRANETAAYRIIGLTVETRPDWVTAEEVISLRRMGCTRVELGLQILNDRVLGLTKRGTTVEDAARAIALLKTAGFKVDAHILPGQPGATPEDDLASFKTLFDDPRFRPDMVKIYPCVVLPDAELAEWHARGDYRPLDGETLTELLITMQTLIPRYCRVPRLVRDFPSSGILAGNKRSNLRETVEADMKRRGTSCLCLRCREVGHVPGDHTNDETTTFEERYENAGGTEVFLSVENTDRTAVFAFLRLRIPSRRGNPLNPLYQGDFKLEAVLSAFPVLRGAAIVRELHTYGTALNLRQNDPNASQHKGYGRRLMDRAEEIARQEGSKRLAVISGIGVREYYRSLGYEERDGYMVKGLKS